MTSPEDSHRISALDKLTALYGAIQPASIAKEMTCLHPYYQAMIAASPFVVLATAGPGGLDASPRGDPPGFVHIEDDRTLMIPERRGNNRIDSLSNILSDPRVALLFLIPGSGETLRVNGRASLTVDPGLIERFSVDDKPPKCVIVIQIDTVFFQCARAIRRSQLWERAAAPGDADFPTSGQFLADVTGGQIGGEQYDRELAARQLATLY